jgi:hypothetical protein
MRKIKRKKSSKQRLELPASSNPPGVVHRGRHSGGSEYMAEPSEALALVEQLSDGDGHIVHTSRSDDSLCHFCQIFVDLYWTEIAETGSLRFQYYVNLPDLQASAKNCKICWQLKQAMTEDSTIREILDPDLGFKMERVKEVGTHAGEGHVTQERIDSNWV